MNLWKIEYWSEGENKSPVEKWLSKLDRDHFKSIYKEIVFLKKEGNEIKLPHSKALGRGLFELRDRNFGYRIYYGFQGKNLIILLTAGDKTSQEKDIKVARERLLKINKGIKS